MSGRSELATLAQPSGVLAIRVGGDNKALRPAVNLEVGFGHTGARKGH
jgi:hypothetical protein